MSTSTVPCRAKDPATCPYHGAQTRAEQALLAGNLDAWLTENANMLAARNIAEVQDFINNQQPSPAANLGTLPYEDDPYNFMARYDVLYEAMHDSRRDQSKLRFEIGDPKDNLDPVVSPIYNAYQFTAERVLQNLINRYPEDGILRSSLVNVLADIRVDERRPHMYGQEKLYAASQTARKEVLDARFDFSDDIDLRQALQNLTLGYDIEANKARKKERGQQPIL